MWRFQTVSAGGSVPGLRSCHSPALGLWLKVESSVWCGNSQSGEKRAALTAKVGILVKKKKPKYVGGEQERGASL